MLLQNRLCCLVAFATVVPQLLAFSSIPKGAAQCEERDPQSSEKPLTSIYDPPTADEMDKVFAALAAFDFGDGAVLTPAPLPPPDVDAVKELFGSNSLATTSIASPGRIWGGIMHNYVARQELYLPNKAEALAYLAGTGPAPARYAEVHIALGALETPRFVEYKVGPLDGPAAEMEVIFLSDQLFNSRSREGNEMRALKLMVDLILNEPEMQTITQESFGGAVHGTGLNNHEPAPPGLIGTERKTPILVNYAIQGTWRGKDLHLVPLSFTINNTDADPSKWTAYDFYYSEQGPFTHDEFIAKYQADEIEKVTIPPEYHLEVIQKSAFPARRPELPDRKYSELPGPQAYMPEGARYDVYGRTVEWMGWRFHAGYNFRAGPDFHAISFKGESVAYQIALNEIGLIYSGNDPVAGNAFFLDSNFGNGEYRELIRGVDCPAYATYLTNYWWAAPGGAQTAERSVCVYELGDGGPLWRRGGPFVSGLKDYTLNVRFVMPNGNYDYMVTYSFSLDGHMRVELGSSGFMQTHYFAPSRGPKNSMAYRVHDYVGASLHDHTFGFKVDLDILGTNNSFETVAYKMADTLTAINAGLETPYAAVPPYLKSNKMRYVEYGTVATEEESLMTVNPLAPKTWTFGDKTQVNKWGNTRAYKLGLDANPSAVVDADHYSMPAFSYAKQMLAVTQHKEEEKTITGAYDLNRLDSPTGAFEQFVDGESIEQVRDSASNS